MTRRRKIYEGKAKILYQGPKGTLVQHFKDDVTAFNKEKHALLDGKGALNNRISECIMLRLAMAGIPNHFIRRLNMREQLVHQVSIIPVEVIVRNWAAGSMARRLGLEEGTRLARPIVEYCYKSDELGDPLVTEEHITTLGWASAPEIDDMFSLALRVNDVLTGMFMAIGIRLIDFKLEFGRTLGEQAEILLADEITPDTCRLWNLGDDRKMDKDRFRHGLGSVVESYREVARRLGLIAEA